jgi:hypothetical protein
LPIDYEKEVIRHPLIKQAIFGTLVTFTFTDKYPNGQIERLVVYRNLLGAYLVTIWIKGKDHPTELRFDNQWGIVERKIRFLLQKHDCRPFKIGSP